MRKIRHQGVTYNLPKILLVETHPLGCHSDTSAALVVAAGAAAARGTLVSVLLHATIAAATGTKALEKGCAFRLDVASDAKCFRLLDIAERCP